MLVSLTHINTRAFVLDSMNGEGYGPVVTVLEMYMRTAVGLSSLELQPEHMMVYSDRNIIM